MADDAEASSRRTPSTAVDEMPPAFFFGGSSWGCIYDVGVYSGLRERYGAERLSHAQWGGVSSGALAAVACALGWEPHRSRALYDELARLARAYGVFGKMSIYHELILDSLIPASGDEWRLLCGRLHIGVTYLDGFRFALVSKWSSNQELRDVLHASMHIPFYMTHIAKVKGYRAIDGGFSCNIAQIGSLPTCTICVASRMAHVHPRPMPSLRQLFAQCYAPADAAACDAAVALGRRDALQPARLGCGGDSGSKGADIAGSYALLAGTPAALLPGPALPRLAVQYAVVASGWALRRMEELVEEKPLVTAAAAAAAVCGIRARL